MPDAPEHSYTVLRIKRKATEPPLSSLVIQDEPEDRTKIKKRRDITGRARGIFRLAETVPDTWEGRGEEGLSLRERIKALLSPPTKSAAPVNEAPMTPMTPLPPSLALPGKPSIPDIPPTMPAPSRRRSSGQQLQYRVVPPPKIHRQPMLPPKVITIEEEEAAKAALNFVDAEAVAGPSSPKRKASTKPVKASAKEEKEMEAFLPMLEEYLKLEESKASLSRVSAIRNGHSSDEEHYVYDLYYRDVRTVDSSSSLGFGVGDGVHIGALLGYTDDSPPSTPSDSEPEDEADEDSNDEDFYRNDYPEDEDADEDMVNYRDAFDDDEEEECNRVGSDGSDRAGLSDNDDNDRDGNRGIWSYR